MDTLSLLNRNVEFLNFDIDLFKKNLKEIIYNSRILVIGAAGTIGKATVKEVIKFSPKVIHAVDISENNIVELVRDLRSSDNYNFTDFKTFAIDCGGKEFENLIKSQKSYDYVFNLSALKHVRSEKDPYTIMRMIKVNIFNTIKILKLTNPKKYFCVSTDKATNPINMMGASKSIMEKFLLKESKFYNISMARFANVAFSDGSLLHGFNQRFLNRQPFSAPSDIKRYFITERESGQLCMMSCFLGQNRDIFFPKIKNNLDLIKFSDLAKSYLKINGFEPYIVNSEEEARRLANKLIKEKKWPCFFFTSDTTGEKNEEEFYTNKETIDLDKFKNIGVIKNKIFKNDEILNKFTKQINLYQDKKIWLKTDLINFFKLVLPEFTHNEIGKNLDEKM